MATKRPDINAILIMTTTPTFAESSKSSMVQKSLKEYYSLQHDCNSLASSEVLIMLHCVQRL